MKNLKPLVIGDLTAKIPVIQGGMGVGISLHSLAGAVAKAGGIGLISTAQIGFKEPDFRQKPLEANLRAIGKELRKAREIAPDGVLGFNIMVATHDYGLYVKEAVSYTHLDVYKRQLPEYGADHCGHSGHEGGGHSPRLRLSLRERQICGTV